MFIVVADHKVVLVTDVDDLAWQEAQDLMDMGECEHAYSEEVYEHDFDDNGLYTTTEGDVISLTDYQKAENYLR